MTRFVGIKEAFEIVVELARGGMLTEAQCDGDASLLREYQRQLEAINTIEDLAVNTYGDD